jgi:hypothetical protein
MVIWDFWNAFMDCWSPWRLHARIVRLHAHIARLEQMHEFKGDYADVAHRLILKENREMREGLVKIHAMYRELLQVRFEQGESRKQMFDLLNKDVNLYNGLNEKFKSFFRRHEFIEAKGEQ